MGAKQVLLLSAWFGLVTGFGELLLLGVKKFVLGKILLLGPQSIWMAPLANVLLLLLPGLVLAFLASHSPNPMPLAAPILILASLSFLNLLLIYSLINLWAAALLAAGLAVQLSRLVSVRQGAFMSLVNRSMGWLSAIVFASCLILIVINP